MSEIKHENICELFGSHKSEHKGYEYTKRVFLQRSTANQCTVSVYEIAPGKSAYPYHYHTENEEVFYIISGSGVLRTPEGERNISTGDLIFFPANDKGAHKLTNSSDIETLMYLDFDTVNDIDVSIYPDSDKIGVWGKGINRVFKISENVDYYKDE